MAKTLKELIAEHDLIIVAIGDEWNWIKRDIREDSRYSRLIEYASSEDNNWLLPILEYEYCSRNSDEKTSSAYKALRELIGDKSYFLISEIYSRDAEKNGFDEDRCVYPCGNYKYLQTNDLNDDLVLASECDDFQGLVQRIRNIVAERGGSLLDEETFYKPFFDGKLLYLNQKRIEYSNINYNEKAYLEKWDKYMKYLTGTINKSLLLLELGVGLDYPTVIRWPFEKVAFLNKQARLVRVHERLYHHTPEIQEKTDSIQMNSVDYILQESTRHEVE
jgi:hypothetical protein